VTTPLGPVLTRPGAPLARRNPLAKVAAAAVPMAVLLPTVDPVTPALLLAATLLALPATGVGVRALARRAWPLLVGAGSLALANALFAADQVGSTVLHVGPVLLTTGGLTAGAAAALRVLAIALPGVLAVATIDPVDLADALVQQARVSPRFAYGALAALRLLPLLTLEWHSIARARRARGVDAGRNPVAAVRLLSSQVLALLVGAIRRGTRLATAMDARGFGVGPDRTFARAQRMGAADWALPLAAAGLAAAATATSLALGAYEPLLG